MPSTLADTDWASDEPQDAHLSQHVSLVTAMELQELFDRLDSHRGSFPEDLVAEAISRREEIVPLLLEMLEEIDRNPEPWVADPGRMVHIYALYLLALFRETRAYPLVVRIFSRPGEFAFDLAGDVVTQDLGRILASVSGGDATGITALIEDEDANRYVREVAMDAMVSLVNAGQKTREEVMAYFLGLFHKLERKPGSDWDALANACADLWPEEAMEELRLAFEEGLVDPGSIAWDDVEDALALGKERAMQRTRYREPFITDLAEAMGWMQCFDHSAIHDEMRCQVAHALRALAPDEQPLAPILRVAPKIGRNEPCPCGSGKKFKKCCGIVN